MTKARDEHDAQTAPADEEDTGMKGPMRRVDRTHFMAWERVPLTISEKALWADKIAEARHQLTVAVEARKAAAEEFKKREKDLEGEMERLARDVREGEERQMPRTRVNDYATGTVLIVHGVTGEVLESRPMTIHERQVELPV